jgi:glycosyltransferase involved in cell wall biosynthesis
MLELLLGTPMEVPSISVVIPNYNYGSLLEGRIDQVLRQTLPPCELIVLDDASTDNSRQVLDAILPRLQMPTTLRTNEVNSGSVAAQWREGVRVAQGEYVWIAEADDVADPELLEVLLTPFGDTRVVMSYCQSRQVDEAGRVIADDYLDYTSTLQERDFSRPYLVEGLDEISHCLGIKNSIPNVSAVLFKRDALLAAFDRLGDSLLELKYAADWRLYVEVLVDGKIAYCPRAFNGHRRHAGSVIGSGDAQRHVGEIELVQRAAAAVPQAQVDSTMARLWVEKAAAILGSSPS